MKETLLGALRSARETVAGVVRDYIVVVRGRSEGAGLVTARALLRAGPLGWFGLSALLLSAILTVYLVLQGQAFTTLQGTLWEGQTVSVPAPALPLSLVFIALGWAYALTAAALVGHWVYLVAVAYVTYFGLYAGISVANTLWFALPSLWMLVLGAWVGGCSGARGRWVFLLALSVLSGLFTYGSLGLPSIVPHQLRTWGQLALGGLYFALIANPWTLRPRSFRPGLAWAITAVAFGALYTVSLVRSPRQEVLVDVFLGANGLLSLISLFWYWVGLDLFNSAQDLAEWVVNSIGRLVPDQALPRQTLVAIVFPSWVIWAIVARHLAFGPSRLLTNLLAPYGWGRAWLRLPFRLPIDLSSTFEYHLYVTATAACLGLVLWWRKSLSAETLAWLFGLSVAAFFALWGYFGDFMAVASDPGLRSGLWPVAIFVLGIFWQVFMVSPDLITGGDSPTAPIIRLVSFLGFLLLLGGISLLELSAGYPQFRQQLSLNPLFGALYLGLPYLLYSSLYGRERYTPIAPQRMLALFAMGMLSAIPALLVDQVFFAPLLWLLAVLATVWRQGRWDESWDGIVYTGALGLGFIVFYTHPVYVPIPAFVAPLARIASLQDAYVSKLVYPWDPSWWRIVLAVLGAAVILGYALARARRAEGRRAFLNALLGALGSLTFLAVCQRMLGL